MFLLYIIIILLLSSGITFYKTGFHEGYIAKEQCNCLKGFFIVVVFCRHIAPYLSEAGYDFSLLGDNLFRQIDESIGQLLVVMFLFYSGYGVMESIKKKGSNYIDSIPKRRLLATLANFDVAILLFLLLNLSLDIHYDTQDILLSFTGWESIGNSNWYIFVILCCYLSTYLTFKLVRGQNKNRKLICGGNLLIIICIYVVLVKNKQSYWYDTIFSYPLGGCFSLYKSELEEKVKKHYRLCLAAIFLLFLILFFEPYEVKCIRANMRACLLAIAIVVLSMKVQVRSPSLSWLGKNLFPLYIYQRIGMIIFSRINEGEFIKDYSYLYIVLCVMIALLMGYMYKYIKIKI